MFFLRCAFWLSIVYASMSWPHDAFAPAAPQASIGDLTRMGTSDLATRAVVEINGLCSRHRAECVAEAGRLTSLVAAVEAPGRRDDKVAAGPAVAPRHRARDAKLRPAP